MSTAPALQVLGQQLCWREIGVRGDRSCPKLPEVVHCRNCDEYSRIGRLLFEREAPASLARETAELLAAPEHVAVRDAVSLLFFRLGQEAFALKTTVLQEVTNPKPVHRLPSRPGPVFLGLVNINGELLPCVSASAALGLDTAAAGPATHPRMIVVGQSGNRFVFPADEVFTVRPVQTSEFQPPPATVANAPAAKSVAVIRLEGREVALLDEVRLLEALGRSLNP
jgi:chemotaxis-related protein WspD